MRKLIFPILLFLLLTACAKSETNITFTAVIENIYDDGILVTTADDIGFDRASVGFDKSCKIDFNFIVGQTVEIEILPQIRESYPVQVTAVKIKLLSDGESVEYRKITGEKAAEMMTGDVVVLDVRTKEEYDEGHIKNAVLLPYDEIGEKADELLPDKDKTILIYCRTGRRSEIAAKECVCICPVKHFNNRTTTRAL